MVAWAKCRTRAGAGLASTWRAQLVDAIGRPGPRRRRRPAGRPAALAAIAGAGLASTWRAQLVDAIEHSAPTSPVPAAGTEAAWTRQNGVGGAIASAPVRWHGPNSRLGLLAGLAVLAVPSTSWWRSRRPCAAPASRPGPGQHLVHRQLVDAIELASHARCRRRGVGRLDGAD